MSLYGIKDSANVTLFSKAAATKDIPVLYADYCNSTTLNLTADTVYAMKKTAKAISWDTNREGTLTMEMQVMDLRWIGLLFGTASPDAASNWARRESFTADKANAAFTLAATPATGSVSVFKLKKDGVTFDTALEVTTGYTISGSTLTIVGGAKDDKYDVFYVEESVTGGKQFTVQGDKWPEAYRATFDTMIRDTDGQDHFVQFEFYNIKPKSQMELTLSAEDVCTLSIEWDVLVDNEDRYFTFRYLDDAAATEDTDDETPAAPTYVEYDGERTGNPKTLGLYEDNDGTKSPTNDETFTENKTYYQRSA